ncbi:Z1 domain-containing protein [Scopulibacillus cellulosilyticus]|uniref:Z1 domain-containing protein n=1 Tax=Scopulibacillus cellulosilyticus TaxID=2665665 RepID=A0ABW2PX60_9BACL
MITTEIQKNGLFYQRLSKINQYSIETKQCIENTVKKLIENDTNINRPGMLLGKIQSGKTRTFIGVTALAFDNGYDIAVVLTKGTRALAQQTYERLKKEFASFRDEDVVQIFDIMTMPDNLINYELDQKLLLVVKKEMHNLNKLFKAFFETYPCLSNKRVLIIDDEADFASIGFKKTDKEIIEINRIAGQIDQLRKDLKHSDFLQVTATPYSLYLQPEELKINESSKTFKPVRPAFTELVPVPKEYIGGEYYFEESEENKSIASCIYEPITNDELLVLKKEDRRRFKIEQALKSHKVKSLRNAIMTFMVGGIIRRLQDQDKGIKPKKYSFIIHTEQRKGTHEWQESIVIAVKEQLRQALANDPLVLEQLIKSAYNNLIKSICLIDGTAPKYEEVKCQVLLAIKQDYLMVTKVNSENDINQLLDDTGQLKLRTPLNVFVGGQILDRGVTIGNLIGFYYGRSPRRFQQDTVLQHSRMFGYRPLEDLAVTRFYTTIEIYDVMKNIHEFDSALRNAFEKGGHNNGVVFIQKDSRNKIIPCSPNKLILSTTTTLKPFKRLLPAGFQTGYKTYISKTVKELDRLIMERGNFKKPYLINVKRAVQIIEKINATFDDKDGTPWDVKSFISCMEYLSLNAEGKETGHIWVIVKTERDSSRTREDGRFIDSPDTARGKDSELKLARKVATKVPALILLRQKGEEIKGWRGSPFWWPVLVTPGNTPVTVFQGGNNNSLLD